MGKTVLPGIGRRKAAMPAALALGVLVCAAAGCVRSAETRFYQLDLTPSGAVAGGAGLEIGRLEVADDLARRDILVQKDATEIEYYADAQWAVSVPELVRRKLEAEFGRAAAGEPGVLVDGEVQAFQQVDVPGGAEARVTLHLRFRKGSQVVFQNLYSRQVPAGSPSPRAVAQVLSRALEAIAADVAADAAGLPAN